jgi:hypothetical protein
MTSKLRVSSGVLYLQGAILVPVSIIALVRPDKVLETYDSTSPHQRLLVRTFRYVGCHANCCAALTTLVRCASDLEAPS